MKMQTYIYYYCEDDADGEKEQEKRNEVLVKFPLTFIMRDDFCQPSNILVFFKKNIILTILLHL